MTTRAMWPAAVALLASCTLGRGEPARLGFGDSEAGSHAGGYGGMSGSGGSGADGTSGQGSAGDAGASGAVPDGGVAGSGGSGGSASGIADCTHDDVQTHSGHDYYFCSNYLSWEIARDLCAGAGGSLAVIDDAEENGFLIAHFGPHPSWWIGANDVTTPDEWRWVDGGGNDGPSLCSGAPCSAAAGRYVNFASDQPSAIGDESCGALQSAGTWSDEYCVVAKPFICEL